MIKVQYPVHNFKIRKDADAERIFDSIRKKWVVLTREEWVRQNMLAYLTSVMGYPAKLIAVEKEIMLGELKKRCDIVVYSRDSLPWMIIECKEMNTTLDSKVMDQVLRYHITLPANFLILTNGSYCFGFRKQGHSFQEIDSFPAFI